jgi:hypothetical protein
VSELIRASNIGDHVDIFGLTGGSRKLVLTQGEHGYMVLHSGGGGGGVYMSKPVVLVYDIDNDNDNGRYRKIDPLLYPDLPSVFCARSKLFSICLRRQVLGLSLGKYALCF